MVLSQADVGGCALWNRGAPRPVHAVGRESTWQSGAVHAGRSWEPRRQVVGVGIDRCCGAVRARVGAAVRSPYELLVPAWKRVVWDDRQGLGSTLCRQRPLTRSSTWCRGTVDNECYRPKHISGLFDESHAIAIRGTAQRTTKHGERALQPRAMSTSYGRRDARTALGANVLCCCLSSLSPTASPTVRLHVA